MRIPIAYAVIAALAVTVLIVVSGLALIDPDVPLIGEAAFNLERITPNADGEDDVAIFSYSLSRPAEVAITLNNHDSTSGILTFTIRNPQITPAGDYDIAFSGIVEGYRLPDETFEGEVERRLVPVGTYTWTLTANGITRDETETATGTLVVEDADSPLPLMTDFNVSPREFTPNQDGVADVVAINVDLQKEAALTAYLLGEDGEQIFIAPRQDIRQDDEAGRQEFTYQGGVDLGIDPPPDGEYTVYIEAQDAEGQRVTLTSSLAIRNGGKPRAGILGQASGADVVFTTRSYDERYASTMAQVGDPVDIPDNPDDVRTALVTVPLGDLLVFKLTVENYGSTPIRTTGPPPGTVYDQRQIAASLGELNQDGAWRVGIQCETSEESYPWRWALGRAEDLLSEADPTNDNIYYYLPAGERSVVWGAIRMTNIVETANPQQCWAGLIHEGVAVYDNRIGVRDVQIADTGEVNVGMDAPDEDEDTDGDE